MIKAIYALMILKILVQVGIMPINTFGVALNFKKIKRNDVFSC